MAPSPANTKQAQIKKAGSTVFIAVAIASIIVSMSLVLLNILWGNARYNSKVQGQQEIARDTLETNVQVFEELQVSFDELENSNELIPQQPDDKKNSEIILDALPSAYDFPALTSSINNLATMSAVEIQRFEGVDLGEDALQSSNAPTPESIPLEISVEGSYESIAKFLENLENSIRPINVKSLSMNGTTGSIRADISLETYYQPAFDLTIEKETVQ